VTELNKSNFRIYEYVNEEGITFWSFTKLPQSPTSLKQLTRQSSYGTHFRKHLSDIRRLAQEWEDEG